MAEEVRLAAEAETAEAEAVEAMVAVEKKVAAKAEAKAEASAAARQARYAMLAAREDDDLAKAIAASLETSGVPASAPFESPGPADPAAGFVAAAASASASARATAEAASVEAEDDEHVEVEEWVQRAHAADASPVPLCRRRRLSRASR